MALTGPAITAALEASRAAGVFPLLGTTWSQIALAMGSSIQAWGLANPANLALVGGAVGPAGFGVVLPPATRLVVPPAPAPVLAGLVGAGIVGPTSVAVATAVAVGISTAFSTLGQYTGPCTGVSAGADTAKITVVNLATLIPVMVSVFSSVVGPGPVSGQLALGLANGLAGLLLLGSGVGVVTPAPGTPPPTPPAVQGVTGPCGIV